MFGLITEKRHNRIVKEIMEDKDKSIRGFVHDNSESIRIIKEKQNEIDNLQVYNLELQSKANSHSNGCVYGLGGKRVNLSFYYAYYNTFFCRVTFTPELYDSTKLRFTRPRFGWSAYGQETPGEVEIIAKIIREINFVDWRWSDTDRKPVMTTEHHDIVKIVKSVSDMNHDLQEQLDMVLKAEQCLRIASATAPAPEESKAQ